MEYIEQTLVVDAHFDTFVGYYTFANSGNKMSNLL